MVRGLWDFLGADRNGDAQLHLSTNRFVSSTYCMRESEREREREHNVCVFCVRDARDCPPCLFVLV